MRQSVHILLALLLLWLPFSQAVAACCPTAAGGADAPVQMPHDCDGSAQAQQDSAHHGAGDCQGDCLQLGQLAVVSLPLDMRPDQPVHTLRTASRTRLLPAHQDRLLRPPRQGA